MNNVSWILIIAGSIGILGIFLAIILHLGWIWFTYPWRRTFWKTQYKPGPQGSRELKVLIGRLMEVHAWFGSNSTPIMYGVQRALWDHINDLEIEQKALTAIFAEDTKQREWALRRLSQRKGKKVQAVIIAISEHHSATEEIHSLAKSILKEKNFDTNPKMKAVNSQGSNPSRPDNDGNPYVVIRMEESMSKKNGDTYHVGQAGAVGPNSKAHHFHMTQGAQKTFEELDLDTLAKELETLRLELKKLAQTPEQDMAVGAVASAEVEIKRGDRSKAMEYLRQAGAWAFDVSTKIGIGVATVALKTALGL
jgi:hypothetical protein